VGQARARLEVTDGQLADGVAAMVGVQLEHRPDAVGDKGVIPPGGKQLGLVFLVVDPPHDQPVAPVGGLGDLGDPIGLVGDLDPGRLTDGGDRGAHGLGLADRDRVAHPMASEPLDELGRPESRVHPQGQLAAGAGAAQAGDEFVDESEDAAGGVGRALAQPGVQHLAAAGAGSQQRMVAQPVGVALGRVSKARVSREMLRAWDEVT
jgi:hypothetical protein